MATKKSEAVVRTVEVRFEVDDVMVITDPCYIDEDDGPEFQHVHGSGRIGTTVADCAGNWIGTVVIQDLGGGVLGGERVDTLRLDHRDRFSYGSFEELWHDLGVDSGQMYAGCASNMPLDYQRVLDGYKIDPDKPFGGDNYSDANIIAVEGGVVSSTGYGDGSYRAYVQRDRHGRPAAIEIRFLEEIDEDED